MFLCECLRCTRDVPGAVMEVGCAAGRTTIFLNQFLSETSGAHKRYFCIDTFDGFPHEQVDFEVSARGKSAHSVDYDVLWRDWSMELFVHTMQFHGLKHVEVIQSDIATYDCRLLGNLSFCLIDVDLYVPVKAALELLYDRMSPGGIIVVDDCAEGNKYDGARQAYSEFAAARDLPEHFEFGKLGVIAVKTERISPSQ